MQLTVLSDQIIADLPVVNEPPHWVLHRVDVHHIATRFASDDLALEFEDNLYCAMSLLRPEGCISGARDLASHGPLLGAILGIRG